VHAYAEDAKRGAAGNDLRRNSPDNYNIMAHPAIRIPVNSVPGPQPANGDYGEWTDHRIPDDRSAWHPLVRRFYDYWLEIAPPGRLPGRQHVQPENMAPWLSRLWLLDVYRDPLRFRCRLAGSEMVRSIGQEVTGAWLDEVHPKSATNPSSRERFRMVAELGRPCWRRGMPRWERRPEFRIVESCLVPLAADGRAVDKVMAVSVVFDTNGRVI